MKFKILVGNHHKKGTVGYSWEEGTKEAEQKNTLKQVVEWGDGKCEHIDQSLVVGMRYYNRRNECLKCWQELQELAQ